MPMIDVPGGKINYDVSGPKAGPWVTLSHSIGGAMQMWDDEALELSKHFRVLKYDIRGHGESVIDPAAYPDGFTMKLLADDVIALWDVMEVEQSHFVGLSLGGLVGIELAMSYPDRLNRLVLCDCRAEATADWEKMFGEREELVRRAGMGSIVDSTLAVWFTERFHKAHPEVIAKMARMITATGVRGYIGCVAAVRNLPREAPLERITAKTMLIVGAEDRGTPPALMKCMAGRIAGSDFCEIPSAAHIVNMEQPKLFLEAVTPFLQGGFDGN